MDYRNGKIAQQILELQNEDGTWRAAENRKADCTYRISMILQKLGELE